MKHRPAYWLCPEVTDAHRDRANALMRRGFLVEFVGEPNDLLQRFRQKRAAIIIVGDEGGSGDAEHAITTLSRTPELTGVRLILSASRNAGVAQEAALHGFRDIIPFDLPIARWVSRFIFSSAGSSTVLPLPSPMLSLNSMASVALPARLDWVGDFLLRLETRLAPPLGSRLTLTGRLVEALGLRSMGVVVMQAQKHDLRYRFSDALICSWDVAEHLDGKKSVMMDHLRRSGMAAPLKVFIAVQSASLRQELIKALSVPGFEIVTALHKHSLIHEPRFFNPHVVILEDKLCSSAQAPLFQEVFAHLSSDSHILVLGPHGMANAVKQLAKGQKILENFKLPTNLPEFMEKRLFDGKLPQTSRLAPEAIFLSADNEFSRIEIMCPARLIGLHPQGAELALPYTAGNFGLCRIEAPLLKKLMGHKPYAKITASYADPVTHLADFPHRLECALGDMNKEARAALAEGLKTLYADELDAQTALWEQDPALLEPSSKGFPLEEAEATPPPNSTQAEAFHVPDAAAPVTTEAMTEEPRDRIVGRTPAISNMELLRLAGIFMAAGIAFVIILWASLHYLAPNYEKSGGTYSEKLQKFKNRHSHSAPGEESSGNDNSH